MQKYTNFLTSAMFITISVVITEGDWHYFSPEWLLLNFYTKSGPCILDLCFAIAAYKVITLGYLDLLILSETCSLCFTVIVWRDFLCNNVWYDLLVNSRYWENTFFWSSKQLLELWCKCIWFCFKIIYNNKICHLYFYINTRTYVYIWYIYTCIHTLFF